MKLIFAYLWRKFFYCLLYHLLSAIILWLWSCLGCVDSLQKARMKTAFLESLQWICVHKNFHSLLKDIQKWFVKYKKWNPLAFVTASWQPDRKNWILRISQSLKIISTKIRLGPFPDFGISQLWPRPRPKFKFLHHYISSKWQSTNVSGEKKPGNVNGMVAISTNTSS